MSNARLLKHLALGTVGVGLLGVLLSASPNDARVADAAMAGDREAVRALLKQGADVNAAQGDGTTPLHWAARRGDVELAQMLIYAGANVRATTRLGGWTPLLMALPAVLVVVVCAWVPGLFSVWLPLSQPNEAHRVGALGCLVFGGVMFAAMTFGGLAAWMEHLGFLGPFLIVGLGTALLLQQWFARIVAGRRWRTVGD